MPSVHEPSSLAFFLQVGISVFVTGGIGGVHRNGENTLDISSDLTELGRTPICVVSAGVKSILDIPKTLEYLETQGVCVAAYKTDDFPAFYSEKSGCKFLAAIKEANRRLDLRTGILIGIPIPKQHSVTGNVIDSAIQTALREARMLVLNKVIDIALVKNNAVLGAQIAASLAQIQDNDQQKDKGSKSEANDS
uniref:Uncharacterized protein n=1 Tax=Lactuca sativa TaxID=4236 RepID=A0A9R1XQ14_LACSA|nr:hypothetical protein LSAT_V11C200060590 [Lactuca sativa]